MHFVGARKSLLGISKQVPLALDGITAGIKCAYSTRKLLSSYNGFAMTVQRASDNATQNIGFVNGVLDTASLATFCSGTTGSVITWFDQSGGGNNLTQATLAKAPVIYSGGAVKAVNGQPAPLYTSASSMGMANGTLSANPTNTLWQNSVVSITLATANSTISGPSATAGLEWRVDQTTGNLEILKANTASIATSTSALSNNAGAVVESSFNSVSGVWAFWINRATAGSGTSAQSMTAATLQVGETRSSQDFAAGNIGEYIAYDQSVTNGISAAAQIQIELNQKNYWGTP